MKLKEKPKKAVNFQFLKDYFENEETEILNEKEIRCQEFSRREGLPECFRSNTFKEELILEHVKKWEASFRERYPERELYLYPRNEAGKEKFISTTLRPTKLGYPRLSEFQSCVQFLSNFLRYEELKTPTQPPSIAPSPHSVLEWQIGDSLDIAMVVCSCLIGSGYDAYVVMGKASKEIATKNESELDCPFLEEGGCEIKLEAEVKEKQSQENQFFIPKPQPIVSEVVQARLLAEKRLRERREEADRIDDDEPERKGRDEFFGRRVHYWVYIREDVERGVAEDLMVDPPTSTIWRLTDSPLPFYHIDQVFNNRDVWVNTTPLEPLSRIDLAHFRTNRGVWASVMTTPEREGKENAGGDAPREGFDVKREHFLQLLDRPLSWVPKFQISSGQFLRESKNGKFTRYYKKLQFDYYSEFQQGDGLVRRVTRFEDFKRTVVREVVLHYRNRRDNLYKRRRLPFEFRRIDYYRTNSQQQIKEYPHWREIEVVQGRRNTIRYYPLRFKDYLVEREEFVGEKTVERYAGRADRLVFQQVNFAREAADRQFNFHDRNVGRSFITKMVQEFEKGGLGKANDQVSRLLVDMQRQKIFVYYHLEEREIAPIEYVLSRDQFNGITPSINNSPSSLSFDKTRMIYGLEKDCYQKIKLAEIQAKEDFDQFKYSFQQSCQKREEGEDEQRLLLRSNFKLKASKMQLPEHNDQVEDFEIDKKDFIGQILKEEGIKVDKLTREEAEEIKNKIIYTLQNRYIERSEIINQRFEDEKNKVSNMQRKFKRKAQENLKPEEEKAFEDQIQNFNLKLAILEQRLFNF